MPLVPGARLGPYEITAFIGAGGMGEVYRARDTRIGRDVAVKILPTSLSQNPDRLQRFEHEARAAGQLNHPNIVALFDVGRHNGTPYVVSELLEGQTLRERLDGGAIGARKAVELAVPLARGLAAAHDKGIVHRDLKPENIFVTRDGQVKILDFGLAKLTDPELSAGGTAFPTAVQATDPGTVLGTVGYMSPEQVRGQPVDHRSDIFAFGAILYEMLAGRRAFTGDTAVETLNAILKEDPPDLTATNAVLPPAMDRIVRHCLEKNPEERFASARDVAFDLQALSDVSGERRAIQPARYRGVLAVGLGVVVLSLVSAGTFLLGRRTISAAQQPSFRLLTFRRGAVGFARFAADGRSVLYNAQWGDRWATYVTALDSPEPRPIEPTGRVVGVGPGEVALIMQSTGQSTLIRAPLSGGAPREVASGIVALAADWARNGEFAIVREREGIQRLEFPTGRVLHETPNEISRLRVSPDAHYIALTENARTFSQTLLLILDTSGEVVYRSDPWEEIYSLAWASDESGVWVCGQRPLDGHRPDGVWKVSRDGTQRLVYQGSEPLSIWDVDGSRMLASAGRYRFEMAGRGPGAVVERDLTWLGRSFVTDIAPDGRLVLFEDGSFAKGRQFTFLGRTDGSAPVQLREGSPAGLSPDGRWALAFPTAPRDGFLSTLALVPTGAGDSRTLPRGAINRYIDAFWFPDGHTILIAAQEKDRPARMFIQDLAQGEPRPFTPEGIATLNPTLTTGGVVAGSIGPSAVWQFYPLDGSAPRIVPGMRQGDVPLRFDVSGRFLFVREPGQDTMFGADHAVIVRVDTRTAARQPWLDLRPTDRVGLGAVNIVRLSADGQSYVYTYFRDVSNLFLVEDLQ